jgi:hypothetical protein
MMLFLESNDPLSSQCKHDLFQALKTHPLLGPFVIGIVLLPHTRLAEKFQSLLCSG